ncbi:rhodopsin-like orphan GPCR isoform 2 [Schistosoma japonicum]|uniref:Rhodopsin-like orphan GPCR isoform 2 n=1 Tax=Schistosoma japonicum TaxID=6182 RepID=A0A4Z2CVV6_SCHJA|nr:rhodopsin-like orphan GPCR isoform 2 [Schistosoma japonicum]
MNTTTLQFSFTFYYYVKYLGLCNQVNDSNIFGKSMILPKIHHQIPFICFSFIGFILNLISLFIFLFGDITIKSKIKKKFNKTKKKILFDNETTITSSSLSSYGNVRKQTRSCKTRSSFMISLILLCICEIIFNFSAFLFKLIHVLSPYFIHQIPLNTFNHVPPDLNLIILPVLQNFLMFLAEIGLFCRNWCVCLITAARAEVVIWPIGSHSWQCILRHPKKFLQIFIVLLIISILIAGLKHTDYIGLLCYDHIMHQYSMWSQEYVFTHKTFSFYMSFIVLPYRAVITWILIILFSIMIIIRLRPCSKQSTLLQISQSKTLDDDLSTTTLDISQHDALRKRQKGQMKATRVVLVVALAFGLLECMNFMISICQTLNLLGNNHLSRLLETIEGDFVI